MALKSKIQWMLFLTIWLHYASSIDVILSPGAIYYKNFFRTIFTGFDDSELVFHDEKHISAMGECDTIKHDLIIRGWWNKKSPCLNLISDVFISSEPWDSSFVELKSDGLLIDCKLSRTLLPPSTLVDLLYFPFYSLSFSQRNRHTPLDLVRKRAVSVDAGHTRGISLDAINPKVEKNRNKFCAFIAKNCMQERLQMMHLLSRIDKVDALGSCGSQTHAPLAFGSNNGDIEEDSLVVLGFDNINNSSYLDRAVEVYQRYKFVICIENSRIVGYVTEKIVNAFLGGAIPIYIGAPDIETHFNPKSFINCNRIEMNACVKKVKQINENETLYHEMRMSAVLNQDKLGKGFNWLIDKNNKQVEKESPVIDDASQSQSSMRRRSGLLTVLRSCFDHVDEANIKSSPSKSKVFSKGDESDPVQQQMKYTVGRDWAKVFPDPSFLWRPKTKTVFDPFLSAVRECTTAHHDKFLFFTPTVTELSVRCQIQTAQSSQASFVACELIRFILSNRTSSFHTLLFDMQSISGILSSPITLPSTLQPETTSTGDDAFPASCSSLGNFDLSSRQEQPLLLLDNSDLLSSNCSLNNISNSLGLVIITDENPARSLTALINEKVQPPKHDQNKSDEDRKCDIGTSSGGNANSSGGNDDEARFSVDQMMPVVSISKIDGLWIKELVMKTQNNKNEKKNEGVRFHMQFKPNVNSWIDALLHVLKYQLGNHTQDREDDIEGYIHCLASIIEISPTSSAIFEQAATAISEEGTKNTHLGLLREKLVERGALLKF